MTHFGLDSLNFPPTEDSEVAQAVHFSPRLIVTSFEATGSSAFEGHGVTRMFSYHGKLTVVGRENEHTPLPVRLSAQQGRLSVRKVRAFIDFAAPRLRRQFKQMQHIGDVN